nr:transcription termination/antitermination protein NusG [uncultured Catonella sp.]
MAETNWYLIHTYSGYENAVKDDIEATIKSRNLEDKIKEVLVPVENVTIVKSGKESKKGKPTPRKLYPGYVFINMEMTDDTWFVIRNTRGVTGFVGPGSKAVPLTDEEMAGILNSGRSSVEADIEIGDWVRIVTGSWQDKEGEVIEINLEERLVTVNIDSLSREMPVEISFTDIKKI